MTVIVYRNGVLAGDGYGTCDEVIETYDEEKVLITDDGRLIGWTGTFAEIGPFIEWLKQCEAPYGVKEKPPLKESHVIEVAADGSKMTMYEALGVYDTTLKPGRFFAWGSGKDAAYGAMHHDGSCTAEQAVMAACLTYTNVGGKVSSVALRPRRSAGDATVPAAVIPWRKPPGNLQGY